MKSAKELQEYLLYDAGVAVLARTSFGRKNEGEDQEYIRLSYATSRENIVEGLRRMKAALERG
jgi:aspartate/methionine/tyrosine aminotransferase